MQRLPRQRIAGISIAEMMVYCLVTVVVGMVVFSVFRTGSSLSAKNASLNRSHDALRTSLDRLASNLRMSRNVPTLLTATGGVVTVGPAAGLRYDRIIGEPYVLDPVSTAGSIAAGSASMVIWRSVNGVGSPPIPVIGDLLTVDTPDGAIRARITAVTAATATATNQKITLTFAAAVGHVLTWGANQPQWARLVRQEAFIVIPNPGNLRNELRFFRSFEPVPSLTNAANYVVVTDQIGTGTGENTPFNVVDVNGDKVVQADVRIKSTEFNRWLTGREANNMNTYFRMNLSMCSRLRPKNTN